MQAEGVRVLYMRNIVFACLAAWLLFPWALAGEEYVYEGRPAPEWAKDLKAGTNVEKAQHALAALCKQLSQTAAAPSTYLIKSEYLLAGVFW